MTRSMLLLLLVALGCGEESTPPPKPVSGPWVGLAEAIQSPTAVDAWTIGGNPTMEGKYFERRETSKQTTVGSAEILALARILNDPKSFSNNPKPCIPTPGVKLRYARAAGEPIWIFFCFDCEEMEVFESGTHREHKDIDPSTKTLAAIMKRIFPASPGIQRLK